MIKKENLNDTLIGTEYSIQSELPKSHLWLGYIKFQIIIVS